jgi:hypothetical protein
MDGGAGDDLLIYRQDPGASSEVFAIGGAGTDVLDADFSGYNGPVQTEIISESVGQFTDFDDTNLIFNGIERFVIAGSTFGDTFITGSGNDIINSGAGDDTVTGGAGDDTLDGGTESDTAVFSGNRSDYTVTTVNGVTTVRDNRTTGTTDGTDTLTNFESLRFANGTFAVAPAAPVAVDDMLAATEDMPATYTFAQLTGNDTDANGDPLTVASVTAVSGGTVVRNADGTVTFTPDADFNGVAAFDYVVSDGQGGTDTGRATINVAAVNDAPVNSVPGAQAGTEDTDLVFSTANSNAITVSDVDSGTLTVTLSVASGRLTLAGTPGANVTGNGTSILTITDTAAAINTALNGLTYRGNLNFEGSDTLTVATSDGDLTDTDTIAITLADDRQINGDSGDNVLTASPQNDFFRVEQGGNDTVNGLAGNDIFFFGGAFTADDQVNGGSGIDTLALQGDYSAGVTLGTGTTSNINSVEWISLLSGSNTFFGESGSNRYSYNITVLDANFENVEGGFVRVNGANLLPGENLTFNGSNESSTRFVIYGGQGTDILTGNGQSDIFFFGHDNSFNAGDKVVGGSGYDGLFLRGDYAIDFNDAGYAGAFSGIENITLSSFSDTRHQRGGDGEFDYAITWDDDLLASGETMTINGALLTAEETMVFDGASESGGNFRLFGGAAMTR